MDDAALGKAVFFQQVLHDLVVGVGVGPQALAVLPMLNKDSGYIQNWNEMYSWGQDTVSDDASFRAVRGYDSAGRDENGRSRPWRSWAVSSISSPL